MSRRIFYIIILLCFYNNGFCQTPDWHWLELIQGDHEQIVKDIVSDPSNGDFYVVGDWKGNLSTSFPGGLGSTEFKSTYGESGKYDGFVAKYNSDKTLIWAFKIGGDHDDEINSISIDSSGDIYIAGSVGEGTSYFVGTGTDDITKTFTNTTHKDAFVVKYNSAGEFIWGQRSSGEEDAHGTVVHAGTDGIYLAGTTKNTTTFSEVTRAFNRGDEDVFIVKYDLSGTIQWLMDWGSEKIDTPTALYEKESKLFVAGNFKGEHFDIYDIYDIFHFPSAYLTNRDNGTSDIFLTSIDTDGYYNWTKSIASEDDDQVTGMVVDDDNIYLTGGIDSDAIFPNDFINGTTYDMDPFLSSIKKSDRTTNWVKTFACSKDGDQLAQDISFDALGNLIIVGTFKKTLTFEETIPSSLGLVSWSDHEAIFVASFDKSSNYIWSKLGGSNDKISALAVDGDSNGNIYVAGTMNNDLIFDGITYDYLNSTDSYIGLLNVNCDVIAGSVSSSELNICSGESTDIELTGSTGNIAWESSLAGADTWTTISGESSSTLTVSPLVDMDYRASLSSGVCSILKTNVLSITLDLPAVAGTISTSEPTICEGSSSDLTLSGSTGIIAWESSLAGVDIWTTISGESSSTLTVSPLVDMDYRASLSSGVCSILKTNVLSITLDSPAVAGTISTSEPTICEGGSSELSLSGSTGIIAWESSPKGLDTWTTISGESSSALTVSPLVDMDYRASLSSGVCSILKTNVLSITLDSPAVAGTISTSEPTICEGGSSDLTLSGSTGIIAWESSPKGLDTWTTISGESSGTLTVSPLVDMDYRASLSSGVCSILKTNVLSITLDSPAVAGTISTSEPTICEGSSSELSLSGSTGIISWESSPKGLDTWTTISGESSSALTVSPLVDMDYRASLSSGVCSILKTNVLSITLDSPAVAGTISTSESTICEGGSSELSLSGSTGIISWESSPKGLDTWTTISGESSGTLTVSPLVDMDYRASLSSGVCSILKTNVLSITLDSPAVAGTISTSEPTICEGGSSDLTLSGSTGIIAWESSPKGLDTWTTISGESSGTLTVSPLVDMDYRASLSSGVCSILKTNVLSITLDSPAVAGTISTSEPTICEGSSSELSLSGSTGIISWESSPKGLDTWTTISGESSSALTVSPLVDMDYRASLSSGVCSILKTNVLSITLDSPAVAGTISTSESTICEGSSSELSLSGSTGIISWESSPKGLDTWTTISGESSSALTVSPLVDMDYRASLSSGVCSILKTNVLSITLDSPAVAGTISTSESTICEGGSSDLTLSGSTGIIAWESSPKGLDTWTTISGESSGTLTVSPLVDMDYRASLSSGVCSILKTNVLSITLDSPAVAGTISTSESTICEGGSSELSLSGSTGIISWESSPKGLDTWTTISGESTSALTVSPLVDMDYRASLSSGVCSILKTNVLSITLDSPAVAGTISTSEPTICEGSSSELSLSGSTGIIAWESSPKGLDTWTTISGESTSALTVSPLVDMDYRASLSSGVCSILKTNVLSITLDSPAVAGTISTSESTICEGSSSELSLSGSTGIISWESSPKGLDTWTTISGESSSTLTVSPLVDMDYRASLSSGVCSILKTNVLSITLDSPAIAGTISTSEPTICEGSSRDLTLSGSTGIIAWESSPKGLDTWTTISGESSSALTVSPLVDMDYRASLSSGVCSILKTNVLSITIDDLPKADAGLDGYVCGLDYNLSATPSIGVGIWTKTGGSGTASFLNDADPNTSVSVDIYDTYEFTWTEVNGSCSNSATVLVNFYEQPLAKAGSDGHICGLKFDLSAIPSVGTGTWTRVSGVSISSFLPNANDPKAELMADDYGSLTLRWTEVNGTCSDHDDITINFYEKPIANAGSGGDVCGLKFDLSAIPSVGTGTWTRVSGVDISSFSTNANDPNGELTADAYGFLTLRWTEVNGTCSDHDDITINFHKQPIAFAGEDKDLEHPEKITLNAKLSTGGFGEWMLISGTGNIYNRYSTSTDVDGLSIGNNVFQWLEINNTCEDQDTVEVKIKNVFIPNVITPNGDGKNDSFIVKGIDNINNVELIIFNRRGNKVFINTNYENDWQGTDNQGEELKMDTYFYVLKLDDNEVFKGSLVITR